MGSSVVACFTILIIKMVLDTTQGGRVEPLCVDPAASDHVIAYDPARQLCCDGAVYDVHSIAGQNCCGKQIFDSLSHTCCGQEVMPIYENQQCCGSSVVFDSETQMCCGNNVYPKTEDFNMCCGNYPMNYLEDTCCHVIGSLGLTAIPSRGRGQCCGLDLTYDPKVQMCCQGQTDNGIASEVVPRDDNVACCGGRSYNTLHQLCCGDNVLNTTSGRTECCEGAAYNPDIEHCCAATVFPIGHGKCCDDQAYHPSSASCCHGVLHDGIPEVAGVQGCCGPRSYLGTESVCCGGELQRNAPGLECCGKDAYNSETHLCCGGNVHLRSTPTQTCCGTGTVSYDPSKETCCTGGNTRTGDQVFPVVDGRCCRTEEGGVVAYNPIKSTCCAGKTNEVFYPDVTADTSTCCGHYLLQDTHLCDNQAAHPVMKTSPADNRVCINRNWRRSRTYNSRTHVCLRGMIRSKNRVSSINGCGPHILDPDNEICCLGRIHPIKDKHGNPRFCCDHSIHSYVPQHQTCCSGRVDNIPAQTSKCCRNRAYNTATHTCDRNGMVRQTSEMALFPLTCGTEPYHPSEHECCGEVLIGSGQTCCRGVVYETSGAKRGAGMCCSGLTGYNPERDICCGDVVHTNIKQGTVCCGSAILNPDDSNNICCNGRLQSSSGSFRMNCSGGTAYNSMTETVCDGVVHPRPNGVCCGQFTYDDSREICCRGIAYPKETPHTSCCGAISYDPTDSQRRCCAGSLHNDPSSSRCCGNQLFDPSNQHCCFNAVHNATYILTASGGRNCSSLHLDNGTMHVFCKGRMHAASAGGSCCGETYVRDSTTQMCCNGSILQKLFGDNSVCCGSSVVDSSVTRC